MIDLAAISSTQHPIFSRPPPARFAADIAHQRFACPLSDHISQLNALHAYESAMKTNNRLPISQWCFDAFLNRRALSEVVRSETNCSLHCSRSCRIRKKFAGSRMRNMILISGRPSPGVFSTSALSNIQIRLPPFTRRYTKATPRASIQRVHFPVRDRSG